MKLKLVIGIVLFVIGLLAAVAGIVGVGQSQAIFRPPTIVQSNTSLHVWGSGTAAALRPLLAGLLLATGGLLIGLSMGDFQHPRSTFKPGDKYVDPEGYHKMKHV
jgi:hypothetical protein